ncbi:ThiF family adenylyltransferase [Desulfuromonas acetoxidans]|uniref:ThiF family adenylyltransferase n=1 Tax=Desulfuromonas acetoxidans TaxID=891 RepID=UPI00293173FB|nr:ThiF family adenylyltransferase [Desulfuromonas acetoxidans]
MSHRLINLNPELKKLRDEGYDVEIRENHLLVKDVPYVDKSRTIQRGVLITPLTLAGDKTLRPGSHVVYFDGMHPCNADGIEIEALRHQSTPQKLGKSLVAQRSFSHKPSSGYPDHYSKMTTYAAIISHQAQALDPSFKVRTFPPYEQEEDDSVFTYLDTATSRAGIGNVTAKLELGGIGIVGLGGSGSYILDLVAKTPVRKIVLIDGDKFSTHNAFRSPGAHQIEKLREAPLKVDYFKDQYSKLHRNIIAHPCFLYESNTDLLDGLDFVFVCVDSGPARKVIVEKLESACTPFIDVGMGINLVNDTLIGQLRVTTRTQGNQGKTEPGARMNFGIDVGDDIYATNVQTADLNAFLAVQAVIKWKKHFGFYCDHRKEHHTQYLLEGGALIHEDEYAEARGPEA